MFFVIDKSKIYSYIIAVCTVVILFVAAAGLNNMSNNSLETSSNIVQNNNANLLNEINNSIK